VVRQSTSSHQNRASGIRVRIAAALTLLFVGVSLQAREPIRAVDDIGEAVVPEAPAIEFHRN